MSSWLVGRLAGWVVHALVVNYMLSWQGWIFLKRGWMKIGWGLGCVAGRLHVLLASVQLFDCGGRYVAWLVALLPGWFACWLLGWLLGWVLLGG